MQLLELLTRSCSNGLLSRRKNAHNRSLDCGEVTVVILLFPALAIVIIMHCDKNMLTCHRI